MSNTNEYAGKTLVLKYESKNEWRQLIGDGYDAVGNAIEIALRSSGISFNGRVVPESISFEVE